MITRNQIDEIVQKIVSNYQPEKIILFGSYANGNIDENSDLDLLIIKNTTIPAYQRIIDVRRLLKGAKFPLDILVYTDNEIDERINDKYSFIHHVFNNSKILYESNK